MCLLLTCYSLLRSPAPPAFSLSSPCLASPPPLLPLHHQPLCSPFPFSSEGYFTVQFPPLASPAALHTSHVSIFTYFFDVLQCTLPLPVHSPPPSPPTFWASALILHLLLLPPHPIHPLHLFFLPPHHLCLLSPIHPAARFPPLLLILTVCLPPRHF